MFAADRKTCRTRCRARDTKRFAGGRMPHIGSGTRQRWIETSSEPWVALTASSLACPPERFLGAICPRADGRTALGGVLAREVPRVECCLRPPKGESPPLAAFGRSARPNDRYPRRCRRSRRAFATHPRSMSCALPTGFALLQGRCREGGRGRTPRRLGQTLGTVAACAR